MSFLNNTESSDSPELLYAQDIDFSVNASLEISPKIDLYYEHKSGNPSPPIKPILIPPELRYTPNVSYYPIGATPEERDSIDRWYHEERIKNTPSL